MRTIGAKGPEAALPRLETRGSWTALLEGEGRAALQAILPAYLVERRWFGGKARPIRGVEVLDAPPLGDGPGAARLLLLRVRYEEGEPEVYSLPAAFAPADRAEEVRHALPGAELAWLDTADGPGLLHSAYRDPAFARLLVDAIGAGRTFGGARGELVAWPTHAFARHARGTEALPARPLGGEQSNTSVRFGDRLVLKLFRKTAPGVNPDLEVGAYLTDEAGFGNVPPVLGALEYRTGEGETFALAMLQGFVANEGDAWTHFLRLAGLHAGGGADLAGPALDAAALLGRRTAELHLALGGTAGREAFRAEPFTPADRRALHARVRRAVDDGLALLRRRLPKLGPAVRARAEAVLASGDALAARIGWVKDRPLHALRTRVHGDYHLGQVLWTGSDFVVIDFEGEPARPLEERRAKDSPLRDVAGMLRSFHYAAYQGLAGGGGGAGAEARARDWCRRVSEAYLGGWLEVARHGSAVPADDRELRDLLDLYLVEKALYELSYELNNRPDWVALPLEGIAALTGAEEEVALPTKGSREAPRAPARESKARPKPPAVLPGGGPGDWDRHLWNEGTNHRAYRTMGAHPTTVDGVEGTSFAVWAPNAERVSVIGDFNGWDKDRHVLLPAGGSGIWQGFLPGVRPGATYKYFIHSRHQGYTVDKADPFGFKHEAAPGTQSIVTSLDYEWRDDAWMKERHARNGLASPMSVYEVHLGSWRRIPEEGNRSLTYRELAPLLAGYCVENGFTHVELLPISEHPFYGSWGYQTTGYFAPTSRYGSPQDFMFLVDTLHQHGVGVILDWVPSHFPADVHGLAYFDGTHLFEHADRRQGHHPDWDSYIFNYGRNEVRSFLLSSATFWLDRYHVDGLRVDAVASMLYLDYSRKEGEWIPNKHGGRENLEAIAFLRRLNEVVYAEHPDVQTIAEESTSWPMVSRPNYLGGLGFGMKWDMGWMHDTLAYFRHEPIHRRYHHNQITFRMMYAFNENFVLALSHDEVVHGKGSLLGKMPGDDWQQRANLKLLYAYQWAQPGKKLLFMGGELGQRQEWSHERSLDWHLLDDPAHAGILRWIRDLNAAMRQNPALHLRDFDPGGFEWVDANDADASVLSFLRRGAPGDPEILVVLNATPVPRPSYRVGVPRGGFWREMLNSDAPLYGGTGWGNMGGHEASPVGSHGRLHSLTVTLPPLGAVFFRREG